MQSSQGRKGADKLRVLMINYEFPPVGGGAGNACYYMLREYARYKNLEIDLVTFSPENRGYVENFSDNIRVFYVKAGEKKNLHYWTNTEMLRWLFASLIFTRKHLKSKRYDLMHCWSGWPVGVIGLIHLKSMPYLVALRGSDIPGYSPRTKALDWLLLRWIAKVVWARAAVVTVLSKDSAKLAKNTNSHINFEVIYNGIDTTEFYPAESPFVGDKLRMLFVGRLIPRKGIRELVRACQDLKGNFELSVIGAGKLEEEISQLVIDLKMADKIKLLGRISHEKLPEIYRQHDVFVMPSHNEALGNVTQEAIASGLALVTTDTGAAELLDGNGVIIEKEDVPDLASKLQELVDDHELVSKYKQKSAKLGREMLWHKCCSEYYEQYLKIINK
ncbi:MAG: glycosyltransferase family 4 protein [Candidatus Dojkabacteria bacterium]